ncbi:MAG: glycosyltransferase family 2 protein [Polyangia bacterium]
MRVLVVIPAFNEEEALGRLLLELRHACESSEDELSLLVVDDGSRDATRRIAKEGGARVLRLCANLGIGGAVQSGLHVAYREGFACAVQLDGDGQHPPGELASLLATMRAEDAPDLLIGSRFLSGDTSEENFRSTLVRRVGIGWLRLVLRVVARTRVTDPTSGFRVYGRRALALFDETYPYDFPEPEAIAVAAAVGLTHREVPVRMRERLGGTSSIGPFDAVYYMVKVTVAVVLAYVRNLERSPS